MENNGHFFICRLCLEIYANAGTQLMRTWVQVRQNFCAWLKHIHITITQIQRHVFAQFHRETRQCRHRCHCIIFNICAVTINPRHTNARTDVRNQFLFIKESIDIIQTRINQRIHKNCIRFQRKFIPFCAGVYFVNEI